MTIRAKDRDMKVEYVLFSHISDSEAEDFSRFTEWEKSRGARANPGVSLSGPRSPTGPSYEIVEDLNPFLPELTRLVTDKANPGILILFYARGYAQCLEGIAKQPRRMRAEASQELRCAASIQKGLEKTFDGCPGLRRRVRVITALDLHHIFKRTQSGYAQNLIEWFIGLQQEKIRYDAPKIVEAIIRVRMIGSGVPVFRIDQDVLFRKPFPGDPGNAVLPALSLGDSIRTCVAAFRKRRDDPRMAAFLFSGSYDSDALGKPGKCKDFSAWSRAFATRCLPALCIATVPLDAAQKSEATAKTAAEEAEKARAAAQADARAKQKRASSAAKGASDAWEKYVKVALDPDLMCRFFGIQKRRARNHRLEVDPSNTGGIGWLGAHPLVSVISGALLCINDSAILDLPPFSNFNLNVSWIDDHLKYSLHRELRHFTTVSVTTGSPVLRDAKIDSVQVVKGRQQIRRLAEYVLGDYLPTLLLGSVMDAWITTNPVIKSRPETLVGKQRADWKAITKKGPSKGVLPKRLQEVLERGRPLAPLELREFRRDLLATALERITEVRNAWSKLSAGMQTFASVWAVGESQVATFVPPFSGKTPGLVRPGTVAEKGCLDFGDLNEDVRESLMMLIDDTVTYIDMTLSWPTIVQFIRSIEPGTLKTDLFWSP